MYDVSHKPSSLRNATARAIVLARPETIARLRSGDIPKGDPLTVAKVAASLAVKNTPQIIPYCHPVRVDWVGVSYDVGEEQIIVDVSVKAVDRTGVEVEAMTGASIAALVLYDMLKMLDDSVHIEGVALLEKRGGKSDAPAPPQSVLCGVLVVSDSVAAGDREDSSGVQLCSALEAMGAVVGAYAVVPDEPNAIAKTLSTWVDQQGVRLLLTTGGTGLGPRDSTPEAMDRVFEREAPGIVEALRKHGQDRIPVAMLGRGRAGVRKSSLIVNLPGSAGAVADALDALFPALLHAVHVLDGGGHDEGSSDS